MLGLGWRTGSKLEEKAEKGFRQGHSTQVSSRNVNSGVVGITSWMEMPYLRRERALCRQGYTSSRACTFVLGCLTPCSQASGMSSLVPAALAPLGLQGSASLVPGHLTPLLPALLLFFF